jgi:AraC-like DNA-binding protein
MGPYEGYASPPTTAVDRHLPQRYAPLVIGFGAKMSIATPAERNANAHQAFLAGMHESFAESTTEGDATGIQVNLTPIGAAMLTGIPMPELANRCTGIEDIFGQDARTLPERLAEARDWPARFDLVDALLLSRLESARTVPAPVAASWRALERTGGRASIGALAEGAGWSRKHFIDQFRTWIGLAPKSAARVIRFGRVLRAVNRATVRGWAAVAAECGYYDQAHLIRDFTRFAGTTPGEYVAGLREPAA